jgi:hypothetical protein
LLQCTGTFEDLTHGIDRREKQGTGKRDVGGIEKITNGHERPRKNLLPSRPSGRDEETLTRRLRHDVPQDVFAGPKGLGTIDQGLRPRGEAAKINRRGQGNHVTLLEQSINALHIVGNDAVTITKTAQATATGDNAQIANLQGFYLCPAFFRPPEERIEQLRRIAFATGTAEKTQDATRFTGHFFCFFSRKSASIEGTTPQIHANSGIYIWLRPRGQYRL